MRLGSQLAALPWEVLEDCRMGLSGTLGHSGVPLRLVPGSWFLSPSPLSVLYEKSSFSLTCSCLHGGLDPGSQG